MLKIKTDKKVDKTDKKLSDVEDTYCHLLPCCILEPCCCVKLNSPEKKIHLSLKVKQEVKHIATAGKWDTFNRVSHYNYQ